MAGECAIHVEVMRNSDRRIDAVEADNREQWDAINVLQATSNKIIGIGIALSILMPVLTGVVTALIIKGWGLE